MAKGDIGHAGRCFPKSAETRERMRAAALRRYADPKERAKTKKAVKAAFVDIDRSGSNNARFGQHCTDETKKKISDRVAERGGHGGMLNPNYRHGAYCKD